MNNTTCQCSKRFWIKFEEQLSIYHVQIGNNLFSPHEQNSSGDTNLTTPHKYHN